MWSLNPHQRLPQTSWDLLTLRARRGAWNLIRSQTTNTAGEDYINYWGYHPIAFFVPHTPYASRTGAGQQVREFKEMVKSLHAAGMAVVLDIVVALRIRSTKSGQRCASTQNKPAEARPRRRRPHPCSRARSRFSMRQAC